ncbi:MAG: enoyl-CoA hydratase [Geminicoccaceae bacterium]|nr:enoyl-CoA hydratase [Geminicoccaceae bacterium]
MHDEAAGTPLLRRDEGGVTVLTLNRPAAFNSLSKALLQGLLDAVEAIAADPERRVVVVEGQGPVFSAGHDLKEIGRNRTREGLGELFGLCSILMTRLTTIPQPVIAKVDGIATAAGCQLVAACDLAVCSETSRFATSGVKYGLFCATPMVALARAVPRKAALEMLLTGDFIDAREARRIGLVNRVVPKEGLDAAVMDLCGRLLDKPAEVLALGKRAFYAQVDAKAGTGLEAAYARATGVIVDNALGESFAEGLDAFTAKRRPDWSRKDGA